MMEPIVTERINALVKKIKEKKELKSLDETYVLEKVQAVLTPELIKKLVSSKNIVQFARSKEYKFIRSEVRADLRKTYGVFQKSAFDRDILFKELKKNPDDHQVLRKILASHQSTQERVPYYTMFYQEIFSRVKNINKIFDIGCGLNPASYTFLCAACGNEPTYNFSDVSSYDMTFLNAFYDQLHLKGKGNALDALDHDAVEARIKEEEPDLIFLLKVVNTFESMQRHSSKKLLARIGPLTKYLVVSLATLSLGGGKEIPSRTFTWFENFVQKMEASDGWSYDVFELPNEKVFVIKTQE